MMKKCLTGFVAGLLVTGMAGVASSTPVNIDFNDLASGVAVTDQYESQGVLFSLLDTPAGYVEGPVTRTINSSTYPGASGIAITAGDDSSDPFYDIELSFAEEIDYFSMLALDADEEMWVRGYFEGTLVEEMFYPAGTNTQVWTLELGAGGMGYVFDTVVLDVVAGVEGQGYAGGPEFFDELSFNTVDPVPEPASMLLFGTGLVGLAGLSRRRRK